MKIVILDYLTLGTDLDLSPVDKFGTVVAYKTTKQEEAGERIKDADVVIVNKIKMNEAVLSGAKGLKLICETATGYDNIDIDYCKKHNIAVANTPAYSTGCVAQVTLSVALSLATHLSEYTSFVKTGKYQESNTANCLVPVYHEIAGKTWGVLGFGNIGRAVARAAEALGCKIIVCKRTKIEGYECVDIDTLCRESDIISIHCPLTSETKNIIGERELSLMKNDVMLINMARGGVWDEEAVASAVLEKKIGALGCDVFTTEPFSSKHPFSRLLNLDNVILTPHMAWGSFESRTRCFATIASNIDAFIKGKEQNRIV